MDSGLACNTRIQRLLWTQDYITLTEEVILLESSFVLNRRNNLQMRMVQVGLTSSALLIAEDKLSSDSPANKYLRRCTKECNSDLELFELIYLFPLANVRLSVRTHSEMIGEHVMRVRLCNGLTWYLELSDMRHGEDKWHEWVWWIHELEKRRKLESKLKRKKLRMKDFRGRTSTRSEHGSLDSESITSHGFAIDNSPGKKNLKSVPNLPTPRTEGRRESTAHRWVHHFAEHIIDHHDENLPDSDNNDDDRGSLHGKDGRKSKHGLYGEAQSSNPLLFNAPLSHSKLSHHSSKMWSESHLTIGRSPLNSRHSRSRATLKNRMQSVLQSGEVDSLSSLEDIESIGSLVSSSAESWTNRDAMNTRKGLILSIDDLFERTNFEAHAHGHVGRARPMASMTRLDVLLEKEATDRKDQNRKAGINKGEIHHTASLPDVLEGEASFIEDLPNADDVTHRASLVYLDLENDDDSRTPHVINGHVILLTKEEMALHKLVDKLRKTNPDPRLKIKHAKKDKTRLNVNDTSQKKKRRWSIAQHFDPHDAHSDHHNKTNRRISRATGKRMSIFFTGANRKLDILRESPHESHAFISLRDVHPDDLVDELTAVDAELFLRIHEAELVDCMWLKEDRNYRASNVLSAINFFKNVAAMVTKEVLLPSRSTERALVIMHSLRVAKGLMEKKNYHSVRAVLAGLQSPAVYRLRDTWLLLDEQHPAEYQLWQDLLDYTHDEALSLENDPDLDQAMRTPPCLPFLGSLLMRIIDFYSTIDINGTRLAHKLHDHHAAENESSNASDYESAIDIVEGHILDDSEKDNIALEKGKEKSSDNQKSSPKLFSLFKKIAHKVDSLGSKQSSNISYKAKENDINGMKEQRKQHIRMLILEYAKLVAEERRRVEASNQIDKKLRRKLLEDFEGVDDDRYGDVHHTRSRHYSELRHMAHAHDSMPWKHKWTSEFHMHEALLQFQLSAVQYQPREKNHAVRELLFKEFHYSDEENFNLSLEREPPERFHSIHNLQERKGEL